MTTETITPDEAEHSREIRQDSRKSLRQRAEDVVQRRSEEIEEIPSGDIQDLIHELKVHQVELEMQNEELRRAQQELERSRDRYSDLYEFAPVGYVTVSEAGTILEANLTAATMLDVERGRLIEQSLSRFIAEDDQDIYYHHRREIFETREPQTCELRMVKEGGSPFWAQIEARTSVDGEEEIVCRATLSDVTERKRVEEEIERYAADLEVRNKELDAFAHTVAHDIKSPLNTLLGFSEILEDEYAALSHEERRRCARGINKIGRKLDNIVDELLLLAEVRKGEVNLEPLDVGSIMHEARERVARLIEQHQAEVILPDTWPSALGYRPWVEQIWVNYISNAIKYGGRADEGIPPRVELGLDRPAVGHIRFWVRDNGPGLTRREQERLFTPFTRLDQTRAKGHGLGLSIVRSLVEKLGGEVDVESEVGQGSTFYFTLPK
jgi:PAS domain S-box-containing protein